MFENFFGKKFSPHGYCYAWKDELLLLHVGSDALIFIAYMSIPLAILYFLKKKNWQVQHKLLYGLFALFILSCGFTHFMGIITVWQPYYYPSGLVKLFTAIVSLYTLMVVLPAIPKIVALPDLTSLLNANTKLEEQIKAKEQAQQDLLIAKENAEKASIAKSDFLRSMSHELRTPLHSILGFGQILEMDESHPLNEDQIESLSQIMKSGNHLLTLINEVLDLSAIESGNLNLSIEDVDPREVVSEVLDIVNKIAAEYRVNIICDISQLPGYFIKADRLRLKQVLLNLMSNAVKYNHKEGNVTLKAWCTENNGYQFQVIDSGAGIPKELQAKIFRPFDRLGAEGGAIEGTGIGLTISKKLAEKMTGSLEFISKVNVGSTFFLDIPISETSYHKEESNSFNDVLNETGSNEQEETYAKILYVEDNPANIILMKKALSSLPIKILEAYTAEIAIPLIEYEQPDLIFMDINLPGMDGFEALNELKKNRKTSLIPVYAVSANAMPADIKKGLAAGFEAYITKPFKIDQIKALVHSRLFGE